MGQRRRRPRAARRGGLSRLAPARAAARICLGGDVEVLEVDDEAARVARVDDRDVAAQDRRAGPRGRCACSGRFGTSSSIGILVDEDAAVERAHRLDVVPRDLAGMRWSWTPAASIVRTGARRRMRRTIPKATHAMNAASSQPMTTPNSAGRDAERDEQRRRDEAGDEPARDVAARSAQLRRGLAEQLPRDDQQLDLLGALEDVEDLRVARPLLEQQLLAVAERAARARRSAARRRRTVRPAFALAIDASSEFGLPLSAIHAAASVSSRAAS